MRRNLLDQTRGVWLRECGDLYEYTALGGFPALVTTLTQITNVNALQLKVADGLSWVGDYDRFTPITSLSTLRAFAALLAQAGVQLVPVVVARGLAQQGEAEFHATIAAAFGCLIVDIENGPRFYDQSPAATIPAYWAALRAAAGDAFLVSQPDPRNLDDVYTRDSAPSFDALACQHYVGWQDNGPGTAAINWLDVPAEVARFRAIAAAYPDKLFYPTLMGSQRIDLALQFWSEVAADAGGVCAFALGSMDKEHLQLWAYAPLPPAPAPPAPPAPPPSKPQPNEHDLIGLAQLVLAGNLGGAATQIQTFDLGGN